MHTCGSVSISMVLHVAALWSAGVTLSINSGTSGSEHRLNLQPWLFQCASVPSQVETERTLNTSMRAIILLVKAKADHSWKISHWQRVDLGKSELVFCAQNLDVS